MNSNIDPKQLQQVYLDFKKIVDRYFSEKSFSEGIFDSSDMASAIEEMMTICQRFARELKGKQDENHRSASDSI